jgi:hypothetical protein
VSDGPAYLITRASAPRGTRPIRPPRLDLGMSLRQRVRPRNLFLIRAARLSGCLRAVSSCHTSLGRIGDIDQGATRTQLGQCMRSCAGQPSAAPTQGTGDERHSHRLQRGLDQIRGDLPAHVIAYLQGIPEMDPPRRAHPCAMSSAMLLYSRLTFGSARSVTIKGMAGLGPGS